MMLGMGMVCKKGAKRSMGRAFGKGRSVALVCHAPEAQGIDQTCGSRNTPLPLDSTIQSSNVAFLLCPLFRLTEGVLPTIVRDFFPDG